jgi:hypothetical protein
MTKAAPAAILAGICEEMLLPVVGLFAPSPTNPDRFVPRVDCPKPEWFRIVGGMMALCYITKLRQPFAMARLVWKSLIGRAIEVEDICEIDTLFRDRRAAILRATKDDWEAIPDRTWTVMTASGAIEPVKPGGATETLTFEGREDYLRRAERLRVKEFDAQLALIREGFDAVIPTSALAVLSPWELEPGCRQRVLARADEGRHQHQGERQDVARLWRILERFTPMERMFIKFGSGWMGLPGPGRKWKSPLTVGFCDTDCGKKDEHLPHAGTCGFSMLIPRYATEALMKLKLRQAVTMCADITDGTGGWPPREVRDIVDF